MQTREEKMRSIRHILLTKGGELLPAEKRWLEYLEQQLTR
jgi:hypothetical protein